MEVLKQRYLECECPWERTHWHIIWLLADTTHSRTPRQVAEIVGCTADWVRKLLKRYNAEGEAAIRDKRKNNRGQRFLDETQQAALESAPSCGRLLMADFGQVLRWLRGYLRHSSVLLVMCQVGNISSVSVGLYKDLVHNIRQLQHQMRSKHLKKLKERVVTLESQHPEKPVEVWAEDETRLGLLPVHRRVWAKQGERPIAPVCPAHIVKLRIYDTCL